MDLKFRYEGETISPLKPGRRGPYRKGEPHQVKSGYDIYVMRSYENGKGIIRPEGDDSGNSDYEVDLTCVREVIYFESRGLVLDLLRAGIASHGFKNAGINRNICDELEIIQREVEKTDNWAEESHPILTGIEVSIDNPEFKFLYFSTEKEIGKEAREYEKTLSLKERQKKVWVTCDYDLDGVINFMDRSEIHFRFIEHESFKSEPPQ